MKFEVGFDRMFRNCDKVDFRVHNCGAGSYNSNDESQPHKAPAQGEGVGSRASDTEAVRVHRCDKENLDSCGPPIA